jgi:hypothetical protein
MKPPPTGPEPEPLRGLAGFLGLMFAMWAFVVAATLAGTHHLWPVMGVCAAGAAWSPFAMYQHARRTDSRNPPG